MENILQYDSGAADGSRESEYIRTVDLHSMVVPACCADAVVAAFKLRAAQEGWIGIVTDNSATPASGTTPDRLYTLAEAADRLGIREDDLIALLPDIAIVVESPMIQGFTPAHMDLLEQLVANVKMFAEESVYRGGDL